MKLIGTGSFSKVYRSSKNKVLIKSICHAKECLALYHESSRFPKLNIVGDFYESKYYEPVKSLKQSLKPSEYLLYLELRSLRIDENCMEMNYFKWRNEFKTIKNKTVKRQLIDYIDQLVNYGHDINFEISPRNVAVQNGKLILLDTFFFISQLEKVIKNKRKRYND